MFENASWQNQELRYFVKSLLVVPTYMTALGLMNIMAAAVLAVMVFSSQIAHRLLFRYAFVIFLFVFKTLPHSRNFPYLVGAYTNI